jgi:hypothetical protein
MTDAASWTSNRVMSGPGVIAMMNVATANWMIVGQSGMKGMQLSAGNSGRTLAHQALRRHPVLARCIL